MAHTDLALPDLERYRSALVEPEDFDGFWRETLQQAREHDLAATFRSHRSVFTHLETFDVEFSGFGGHRVKAWLHLPRDRGEKTPCVVQYIGYSGGRGLAHQLTLWASAGFAHLVMDTRGQGCGSCPGDTPDPYPCGPSVPGFMTRGIESPHDYFYRRVFTDAVRCVEVAAGHPQVDAGRIAVTGISQGGGITLAAAALADPVAAVLPDVPFLCDFTRAVAICDELPYAEIRRYLASHRDAADTVFRTLGYVDGVAFARRAQAPAHFSVALMDTICPPSTVYGAYNAYGGEKSIQVYPFNDHEGGLAHQELAQVAWLRDRFAPAV